ncbi:hypothetical protein MJO28_003890 [Puccinia striiformis f. sp. tritici]|uniref:Uncharacterized protein n=1 Tax=Puccinia striiformis f. sp. tritici TaxID=168172 RepID=A0ACC0ENK1_9BASI|nr:hypothetical protein MJO28_003890 [Puccinia striiformis f. sp. tritici]
MPSKRTHMQVQNNFTDCDLNPDIEPLSPLPETPIQDENIDAGGNRVLSDGTSRQPPLMVCLATFASNASYLGVTAHWIDNDFSLQSITLAARLLEGSHTGVSLAEHLGKVLDESDICEQIFCITADNASKNRTMGIHLAEMIPFDNKNCLLGCMAHVINLTAQAGIKVFSSTPPPQTELPVDLANILHDQPPDVEVKTIISQINGLTSFLKHSTM